MTETNYTRLPAGQWGHRKTPDLLIEQGHLDRPGHRIYWAEYGNPKGEPVVFVHGGPGSPAAAGLTKIFDPKKYRILMFHQRGCGQSIPNATNDLRGALTDNTTGALIEDIEALCDARGMKQAHMYGGSWGSTLVLTHAIAHPERVKSMTLRGIFLCGKRDLEYFYQGNAATYNPEHPEANSEKEGAYRAYLGDDKDFGKIKESERTPEMAKAYADAWHDYVNIIPKEKRKDMIGAYRELLYPPSGEPNLAAARAWAKWEGVTGFLRHNVSPDALVSYDKPENVIPFAGIENHYFYNILRNTMEGHKDLLDPANLTRIAHIPTRIVHGRYDQICPLFGAQALVNILRSVGGKPDFKITPMGHGFSERDTAVQLQAWFDRMVHKKLPLDHATRVRTGSNLTP